MTTATATKPADPKAPAPIRALDVGRIRVVGVNVPEDVVVTLREGDTLDQFFAQPELFLGDAGKKIQPGGILRIAHDDDAFFALAKKGVAEIFELQRWVLRPQTNQDEAPLGFSFGWGGNTDGWCVWFVRIVNGERIKQTRHKNLESKFHARNVCNQEIINADRRR